MTKRYSSQIEPLKCKSSDFSPLGSQFLGLLERKTESDGGIRLATADTTWWVDVVRVGPECTIKAGERVLVEEFRGENLDLSDGEFTLLDEKQCLAVWEPEPRHAGRR